MGKVKKKSKQKQLLNEKVKKVEKKINPFEVRINREKHNILGQKKKHERGLPGISRSKAIKKRKETLLKEYLNKNKSNSFVDKRIGEYAMHMSEEDKTIARFSHQRKQHLTTYNLNEEEKLTHLGKSILEISKFDNPPSDSDDELDPHFVKEAHFGGFLIKKKETDVAHKSHKEYMNELIADTKLKKHDRQVEKESNTVLTEKLDEEWKTVQSLMSKLKKNNDKPQSKLDVYDLTVRQLQFEARGKAVDRLKTPEEIAKLEKEKLEKLEAERLSRMTGVKDDKLVLSNHLSADDLYDGLQLDINEYNKDNEKENQSKEEAPSDESYSDSVEEGSDNDNYSDIHSDNDVSDTQEENIVKDKLVKLQTEKTVSTLSFVYEIPSTYEEFLDVVSQYSTEEQAIIVDRMIKCNHPSLGGENLSKVETLFVLLLQYFHDICEDESLSLKLIDSLISHVYTLSQLSPLKTAESILDVILEKYEKFQQVCQKRNSGATDCPGLSTLIFFKLCCILYPTSDFIHPVVTPCMLFMSHIITHCRFNKIKSILKGLFVCNLFLEYVSYSKRYVPEVINFLSGIMYLSSQKQQKRTTVIPPFKSVGKVHLSVKMNTDCNNIPLSLNLLRTESETNSEETNVFIINSTLCLLYQFAELYEHLPSWIEIFSPVKLLCAEFDEKNYPQIIRSSVKKLRDVLSKEKTYTYLVQEKKKPQPLKLLEPRFKEKFDGKRSLQGSKEKIKNTLLVQKHKREMKGAVREIRQDNYFLAREILAEKMEKDAERKKKVKELYRDLAMQEGEFKALKKKKK